MLFSKIIMMIITNNEKLKKKGKEKGFVPVAEVAAESIPFTNCIHGQPNIWLWSFCFTTNIIE